MRPPHRLSAPVLAVACVLLPPYAAVSHARVGAPDTAPARPFGAECRLRVAGSEVTADCRNPYPETDLVALHVECARWWDLDGDGSPVAVGPAQNVRLAGRCWKEVGTAWVSHRRPG
ncbi:hypothetical protein ACGFZL_29480 [Streptomyces sp. NPDC048182]|uniref:hypothetical protein n=1 Tax=Streptomyces sp. NPDC048182 TaxID=3365507 RepID=UPI00371A81E4